MRFEKHIMVHKKRSILLLNRAKINQFGTLLEDHHFEVLGSHPGKPKNVITVKRGHKRMQRKRSSLFC